MHTLTDPEFTVAGDLSDAAITALAALLLQAIGDDEPKPAVNKDGRETA